MAAADSIYTLKDDLELVRQYAEQGDKEIVGILFERYAGLVYSVCLKYLQDREESRDASMQVFEKLFIDLKKHQISNFKSWLHSVAKNYCLMQLRKNKGIVEIESKENLTVSPVMEYHNYLHQESENQIEIKLSELEDAMKDLNEEQRICIELFYLKELSYQEVAANTGFDLNQVKSYIQNGKRNLKLIITKRNVSTR